LISPLGSLVLDDAPSPGLPPQPDSPSPGCKIGSLFDRSDPCDKFLSKIIVTPSWLRIDYLHRDAFSLGKVSMSQSRTNRVLETSSCRSKEYPAIW
jgi:hypothetical protein